MCTSRMEIRERQNLWLFVKVSLAAVLILVSESFLILFASVVYGNENFLMIILKLAPPLDLMICSTVTGFVFYYSYQILSSLNNSRHFREDSRSQPDKKNELLSSLVLICMIAQSLKFIVRVTGFVLACIYANKIVSCNENGGSTVFSVCHLKWSQYFDIDLNSIVHLSILEFIWILSKMMRK